MQLIKNADIRAAILNVDSVLGKFIIEIRILNIQKEVILVQPIVKITIFYMQIQNNNK